MRSAIILISVVSLAASLSFGQGNNSRWEKFNSLIGNWSGEGKGKPGNGAGYFSFKLDLSNNILVRNSHAEYPATKDKPLIVHDDLMIVYPDKSGNPNRAIYFDNEGHVINYSITFQNDSDIVFTSQRIPDVPVFKLTYSGIDTNLVNVKFEMSNDGEKFITYVEGRSIRIQEH